MSGTDAEGSMSIARTTDGTVDDVVNVDVFVDFCCPWCLIGLTQIDRAIAQVGPDVKVRARIRPFLLDPMAPPGGVQVARKLREKHGVEPSQVFPMVEAAARACGIALDLGRQPLAYPTQAAHLLVELAQRKDMGLPVARAIAEAYFIEARNIADPEVLADVAASCGMATSEVHAALGDPVGRKRIEAAAESARQAGVMSVPFAVLPGGRNVQAAGPLETIVRQLREAAGQKG